jgi:hypothetical protein
LPEEIIFFPTFEYNTAQRISQQVKFDYHLQVAQQTKATTVIITKEDLVVQVVIILSLRCIKHQPFDYQHVIERIVGEMRVGFVAYCKVNCKRDCIITMTTIRRVNRISHIVSIDNQFISIHNYESQIVKIQSTQSRLANGYYTITSLN